MYDMEHRADEKCAVRIEGKNAGDTVMNQETRRRLGEFHISDKQELHLGDLCLYKSFEDYLNQAVSGEGMVGENYLLLWEKAEIEELNDEYGTQEFWHDIVLIGSDGADMAYGINRDGRYIEVPFIGMDDEVRVIAEDFDSFIDYVWHKKDE